MAQAAAPARRRGSVEYENPILSRLDPVMEHTDLSMRPVLRKKASTGARSAKTSMSKQSMASVSERFKETTEQNMKRELSIGDATASRLRTLPAAQKKILGMKEAPLHEGSSVPGLVRIPPLSIKPDHMYGITLIAHPSMIPSLLQFADEYSDVLSRFKLSVQAELEEEP